MSHSCFLLGDGSDECFVFDISFSAIAVLMKVEFIFLSMLTVFNSTKSNRLNLSAQQVLYILQEKKSCKHLGIYKLNLKSVPRKLRSILLPTAISKISVYETVPSSRRKKLCMDGRLIRGREKG